MSLCAGDVACECQAIFQIVFGWLCDLNRGNWWGHAPYKHGAPCSACPPSYGGGCKDNLCYKGRRKCVLKGKLPKCLMCVDVTICDFFIQRPQYPPCTGGKRGKQLYRAGSPPYDSEDPAPGFKARDSQSSCSRHRDPRRWPAKEWSGQHTANVYAAMRQNQRIYECLLDLIAIMTLKHKSSPWVEILFL